jgi:CubicO group peptidase (beta-lactamase class C family)
MSKQFTADAILILAHQNRINLDDSIQKDVPEVPDFGTPITLGELLHHTSGLRDQWQLLNLDGWRLWNDLVKTTSVIALLRPSCARSSPVEVGNLEADLFTWNFSFCRLCWDGVKGKGCEPSRCGG